MINDRLFRQVNASEARPEHVPATFKVLGITISTIQIDALIDLIEIWVKHRDEPRSIAFCGMHGLMEAFHSSEIRLAFESSTLRVADGMPLVVLGRYHGFDEMKRRVYGPELMMEFCRKTKGTYRHFLYGGDQGVADLLAKKLSSSHQINIVGTITPPYRYLSDEELREHVKFITECDTDIVWVGISTPKQELLTARLKSMLSRQVLLSVGAAFDFNSNLKRTAPSWMQDNGLEWFYRLITEPKRLWRRYLINGPKFVSLVIRDLIHQRNT